MDLYGLLCVSKTATETEIKKAYRKLALKYHPDKNKDPGAAKKFNDITTAYQTLIDEKKRLAYDNFGSFNGSQHSTSDIFSNFQDMFGSIFNSGYRNTSNSPGPLAIECKLSLEDTYSASTKQVSIDIPITCQNCLGAGKKDINEPPIICRQCGGGGRIEINRGFIHFSQTCKACAGKGAIYEPCSMCEGRRFMLKQKQFTVNFPAGLETGQRLKLNFTNNFVNGILVQVKINKSSIWSRINNDILLEQEISLFEALRGTVRLIKLPDEKKVSVNIPAGTQFHEVITVPGLGFHEVGTKTRGNLNLKINIKIPTQIPLDAYKLINELEKKISDK